MDSHERVNRIWWALRIGLGSSAFLAGADKFTGLLADWEQYLAPQVSERLPVSSKQFMYGVGVIEMLVGLGILTKPTRLSSYAAAAWLTGIAGNLVLNGDYDIAVRDLNMAVAAAALGELTSVRQRQEPRTIVQEHHISERVPQQQQRKVTFTGTMRRRRAA